MGNEKQKISALIELNDELENYFQNTIIPQLFVDADFVLRKFTPPAMKQFRLRPDDIGRPLAEIKDNFRFPSILENIQHVIETGEILEKEIQTTDMSWFQMNIIPYVMIREKKTNGVIITFVDITSRIRELKDQESLILEHELLLDTISHDIKTPLTSLGLTIEMLKKIPEKGMDKFPVLLEKVENSLFKIKDIIMDLTESRRSDQHYQARAELLDVEQILEDVRLTLAPQILESTAKISWEVQQSELFFVRRKLRSILYNLIGNSIKYRYNGRIPEIKIKTYVDEDYTVFTITDNGRGIAEWDQEKIFTKYERISRDVEGTGVGLHLVKEFVYLSGGRIEVESKLGKGTQFKLYFKNHNH
ncbi:ATP-binding protein [Pedobacter psychrodurus]|uniref:histidine kinase n=1 Tax=Pedobacter psychrodurus TaxID=2530456 RepID=A0A4V2MQQ2_9SPHI|nr:ATP-binding protein [Pedobacter psychrodurus]TCD25468.1 ATP-binding protein [Pedobacter psychrodurus]